MIERWSYNTRISEVNFGDFRRILDKVHELYQNAYPDGDIIQEVTLYNKIPHYIRSKDEVDIKELRIKNQEKINKVTEKITKDEFKEAKYLEVHFVPSIHDENGKPFICLTWKGRASTSVGCYLQGNRLRVARISHFCREVFPYRYGIGDGYRTNSGRGLL